MGQSATLYRVDKTNVQQIANNPAGIEIHSISLGEETFGKTFEGLRFIIKKGLTGTEQDQINLIFYPTTFYGEEVDFAEIDFENLPADFEIEQNAVYYNEPTTIQLIDQVLSQISTETFLKNFNAEELISEDIYPGDVWNNNTGADFAYNAHHMATKFEKLKSFFKSAADHENYVICFVG